MGASAVPTGTADPADGPGRDATKAFPYRPTVRRPNDDTAELGVKEHTGEKHEVISVVQDC